ncbi:VCBS repeat-containing protein [Streptomyces sp. MW-W600-10]|uniref:FG-GAP repeat domain-containing protein n=1 Tax=Streptomyces sp. MW-W600-10 TaxID=2829819 RepID=UPI001C47BEAE|nr:VCBS repeat-containing protein [Streptomyces sp. MW-W600-10]MBV7245518.1 VCBS repeat-containing protein [Streptomyces sp. MW-W600-10]
MRPRTSTEHPQAAVTSRVTAALAAGCTALLLALTACAGPSSASDGKNGDTPPAAQSRSQSRTQAQAETVSTPVPRGTGSRVPYDFNGDGHRDLVIDDLVKAPEDSHGDDAGIGIVYGSGDRDRPLDPAARQLLSARANAAKSGDTLPAAFDSEAACDLDRDGFTDLIVSTDPPYNGIGAPPVPLQILFGSPQGLTGKAVTVRIPQQARFGNEWPEQPVCGDFDGDGRADLAVTASAGQVTFLHGPFTRTGAPRSAELLPDGGPYLYAPEPRTDANKDGYDDLVAAARPHAPGQAGKGTLLLGSAKGPAGPGSAYAFAAEDLPTAPLKTTGATSTALLDHGDYDGDKKPDTVVRTYRGERQDLIALYTAGNTAEPAVTFSTKLFLP